MVDDVFENIFIFKRSFFGRLCWIKWVRLGIILKWFICEYFVQLVRVFGSFALVHNNVFIVIKGVRCQWVLYKVKVKGDRRIWSLNWRAPAKLHIRLNGDSSFNERHGIYRVVLKVQVLAVVDFVMIAIKDWVLSLIERSTSAKKIPILWYSKHSFFMEALKPVLVIYE